MHTTIDVPITVYTKARAQLLNAIHSLPRHGKPCECTGSKDIIYLDDYDEPLAKIPVLNKICLECGGDCQEEE